ncbi:MAG: GNAT family N-acetyltransferase [Oscillospiraceae bacterium]|nr:GNAT family N-acetyltransferase [Oscillospiraceae bacterium]
MEKGTGEVRLVKVDAGNFDDLIDLEVNEDQKGFVARNIYSLAEAYATLQSGDCVQPFGIYAGDEPVGFLMIGYFLRHDDAEEEEEDEEEERPYYFYESYLFWRFMIDKEHQRKGYGRQAMKLALDYIRTFPFGKADYCWLSYEPENDVARRIYSSFGFVEEPALPRGWDEIPAVLKL